MTSRTKPHRPCRLARHPDRAHRHRRRRPRGACSAATTHDGRPAHRRRRARARDRLEAARSRRKLGALYVAPGNAGIAQIADCVPARGAEARRVRRRRSPRSAPPRRGARGSGAATSSSSRPTTRWPSAWSTSLQAAGIPRLRADEGRGAHRVVEGVREGPDAAPRHPDGRSRRGSTTSRPRARTSSRGPATSW